MRFPKFLFALFFGAVFLITLFKVAFFLLTGAMFCGAFFLLSRAFGFRRGRYQQQQWANQYGSAAPYEPFLGQQSQSPFEQPLNPNWQKRQATPQFGRRIEVL